MIISQVEIDEIRSARIRRRVIFLPVRYGSLGERKRCPARPGGVYHLKPRVPYEDYRDSAQREPTHARAVVRFIALCEQRGRGITVTIQAAEIVEQSDGPVWRVSFVKDDLTLRREQARPRFLRRGGGYTTINDELNAGQVMDDEVAKRFVEEAAQRQRENQREVVRQTAAHLETLRGSMTDMKMRQLVKRAARTLEAAAASNPADESVESTQVA